MPSRANRHHKPSTGSRLASFLIVLIWIVAAAALIYNRQAITDWYRLRNYTPSAAVASLSQQDSLTDYGRKIFYVNKPEVLDKAQFADKCPNNGGEKTNILGCYHGNQNGIYVLNVDDARLEGVVQVTSAHEMLHAAYDRLSSEEKAKVNAMLTDFYNTKLSDERIKSIIEVYKNSEPNDVVNEMHSIFGTEVANLTPELEAYYKKYFVNRAAVTAFSSRYQAEFTSRQAAVNAADARLKQLKAQIDEYESDLSSESAQLTRRQRDLYAKRDAGNVDSYNAGVNSYNAAISAFNAKVQAYKNAVDEYNSLLEKRNAIAFEENQLNDALSSKVDTINN